MDKKLLLLGLCDGLGLTHHLTAVLAGIALIVTLAFYAHDSTKAGRRFVQGWLQVVGAALAPLDWGSGADGRGREQAASGGL